ncbi:hypothetical protein XF24_00906 [candidate division SR1 bacterium Aalborg_AAW-1]|nr:hypothetical protein XF24_00906 [candidate division SR1 bacterium Aalborg_AAW-1]
MPLVYVISLGLCFGLFGLLTGEKQNPYFIQLGIVIGVLAGFFAMCKLHQYRESQPGQEMIDKATGQEFVHCKNNTFFFMGSKIWLYIFGTISAMVVVSGIVNMVMMFMNS